MGIKNRMRKAAERWGGPRAAASPLGLDGGGAGVKPPWCPFRCAHVVTPAGESPILLPGGAKGVPCQVQEVPLECWRANCMLWDREAEPPGCGLLSLMDEVLYSDEADGGDDDQGVPHAPGG